MVSFSDGDVPYQKQPDRVFIDRYRGIQIESRWEGRADSLTADINGLTVGAQSAELVSNGYKGELTARFGTPIPLPTFTIRTEEISQSIFKHPVFSVLYPAVVKAVQEESTSGNTRTGSIAVISEALFESGSPAGHDIIAVIALDLLMAGDEHYLVNQSYSLSMTRVYPWVSGQAISTILSNDGRIFSSNQLAIYTASSIPFAVPAFNNMVSTENLRLIYGWRKRGTEIMNLPDGNVQIDESWQSARWSLLIYGVATGI